MHLQSIKLLNFKNYEEKNIAFSPHINCVVGENGVGKTNLLDAIHYLCLTRSAFNTIEQQNILHGAPFYMIQGMMEKQEKNFPIVCSYQQGKKKTFKVNQAEYEKFSEHIGRFPIVLVAPIDADLVREGSEVRRKFMDSVIAQTNKNYLSDLLSYTKSLKQRNALLKQFAERDYFDADLLSPYDGAIIQLSQKIGQVREAVIQELIPIFQKHYNSLVDHRETVEMIYKTKVLTDDFPSFFRTFQAKERILLRTMQGIHKDDYVFSIGNHPLKKFGSQGQQKSFIVALKLAQFEYMYQKLGEKPILLLDDIFDKLDDGRIAKLLQLLSQQQFGQVFITDARPERSEKLLDTLTVEVKIHQIEL
ncbi:MAG: DNA replication/repair protein RecF [Flammeovirgaceae bacterium]